MEKILCIGLGKLGLTFAQTLAKNNIVFGFDLDKKIYLNVKKNIRQIEPNLNNLIKAVSYTHLTLPTIYSV